MASVLGWVVFSAFVSLTLMQVVYVWMYCRFLVSDVAAQSDMDYEPTAAIVLCLRGSDPSLPDCLKSLRALDYRDFEIHIVVDDEWDPGLQTARELFPSDNGETVKIHVIGEKNASRSLKCSAILTALSKLDDAVEVVALIDADSIADANWLKDLVHPLADPSVGATTGNRWFAPNSGNAGSVVRQLWNAAAIAQMSLYQIPWGGSLAIKRTTISECDLLETWGSAFCEDTMLTGILRAHGLQVVRVPDLIMANSESTKLPDAFRWIVRQLLTVRLYHPDWPLVLIHALFLGTCLVTALVSIVISLATNHFGSALLVAGAVVLYNVTNALLLRAIVSGNERAVRSRGIPFNHAKFSMGAVVFGMLITQLVQPFAAITAALSRRVSWRGITYAILRSHRIEMIRYVPYREVLDQPRGESTASID